MVMSLSSDCLRIKPCLFACIALSAPTQSQLHEGMQLLLSGLHCADCLATSPATFKRALQAVTVGKSAWWVGREQKSRVGVHAEMASQLTRAIDDRDLLALGKLEQNCVYGSASTKEVLAYLQAHPRIPTQDKVRRGLPLLLRVGLFLSGITTNQTATI